MCLGPSDPDRPYPGQEGTGKIMITVPRQEVDPSKLRVMTDVVKFR